MYNYLISPPLPTPRLILRNLCDTGKFGKLSSEQFALAMHLISRKVARVSGLRTG